jgi:hypothetical protein
MKKSLITAVTISALLMTTTAVFAKEGNSEHGRANEEHGAASFVIATIAPESTTQPSDSPEPTASPTVQPSATPNPSCDPDSDWENHGKFVSCVAKEHLGGQVTSLAAKSDIGKHKDKDDNDQDDHDNHHPRPSKTPEPSSTASATPSPTPPITSAIDTFHFQALNLQGPLERIIGSLSDLLSSLKNLLK